MTVPSRQSFSWWFESHKRQRQSTWLVSTLSELEEKTTQVLKLIEEDADSFAQLAEMYYKKRPELVSKVEELYRSHRSLAEQYDQLMLEAGLRRSTSSSSVFSNFNCSARSCKVVTMSSETSLQSLLSEDVEMQKQDEKACKRSLEVMTNSSLSFDSEDSEVDDPLPEDDGEDAESKIKEETAKNNIVELKTMKEQIEKLQQENTNLRAELILKDEEKREVIRQLSLCADILKEENDYMKNCVKESKKRGFLDFKRLKGVLHNKLFSGQLKI